MWIQHRQTAISRIRAMPITVFVFLMECSGTCSLMPYHLEAHQLNVLNKSRDGKEPVHNRREKRER